MNKETFISVLKMHRMNVDRNGLIQDADGACYGSCTNLDMRLSDGGVLPFDTITTLSFTPKYHQLDVRLASGESVPVTGTQQYWIKDEVPLVRKMPKTIGQLAAVFDELYPDAGEKLYYDVLRERVMIDTSLIGYCDPQIGGTAVVPMDDVVFDLFLKDIEGRLIENNFQGTTIPSKETVYSVINTHVARHKRNEFREWVSGLSWDGKPRVRAWLRDYMGACAPALAQLGRRLEDKYLEEVSQAWILGAIARNFPVYDGNGRILTSVKHEIVPVLIGDQNIGKGSILRMTAGRDDWYRETSRSVLDLTKFLEDVGGRIIVELSEAVQFKNSDAEPLKAFVSTSEDQVRKPYAKFAGIYPRHFILAVTTNYNAIFVDQTGNRRYFPVYCDPARSKFRFNPDRSKGQYDVEQMWAEAYQIFKDGGRWYIDSNVSDLAKVMQEYSTLDNPYISRIEDFLDSPYGEYCKKGARVSRPIILKQVFGLEENEPVRKEIEDAWKLWSTSTRSWQRLPSTTRIGGDVSRGYVRIMAPGEVRITRKIGQDEFIWDEAEWTPVLEDIMRVRGKDCGCSDIGEPFRIDGIPPSVVVMLREAGYIYEEDVSDGVKVVKAGVAVSELQE